MKTPAQRKPPKWATCLLNWYCRRELVEDLEGDLNEYFERNIKLKGIRRANVNYILDVLKFLRPYTVRKPKFLNLLFQWIMISNYIKISGRIILRNRLFSAINIIGLGISMAVGLLLISLLNDMSKYDQFHENHDRIYRVISKYKYLEREDASYYASTSLRAGKAIEESIHGIEKIADMYRGFEGDIKSGEKTVPLSGFWASESFFNVFSFSVVSGDPSTALKNPYTVVLTESSAKKLFGDTNALGKTILYPHEKGDKEFLVTGILKDVPLFSHIKFDMLASLNTREITEQENKDEMAWNNMWSAYTYLLVPEGGDLRNLQTNLNALAHKENQSVKNTTIKLSLQPLTKIALGENMNNAIGPVMENSNVWMIGVLSIIVILSACFNYTNLSIARSLRRSREVGIRKVVGALKVHVLGQFVVEAVIIALLALIFSFALFVLFKPYFLSLNDGYSKMLMLDISPKVILYFILLAIGVGLAAGFFPALFFARVNAIQVLKNISSIRGFGNVTVHKALIVAQFTISLMFIAATIIGYKHYKQVLAFDLGFDTENVLNIRLFGNKSDLLQKELAEMPEVKGLSTSSMVTSLGGYWGTNMKYTDPGDSTFVNYNFIDEHYLPLHGHKLLAGKNFSSKLENTIETEVIVNEKVLKRFGIANQDPSKAVGEIVTVNGKQMQIIGVMKDFQYGKSIDNEIKEFIFRYSPKGEYVNVKVLSKDWPVTFTKIETAWKKIDNVHLLEATFYDEQIESSYRDFSSRLKEIGALSFLAICIASIGLLGMVVFTTETRLKEISIRKVLGATEASLIFLLSKNFLMLLAIATLIALPATHFFFVKYVLKEYADGVPNSWSELMIGLTTVIATAFIMIGSHTLRVARTNPTEVLKSE
jgi:putative ABC transport system permease protein